MFFLEMSIPKILLVIKPYIMLIISRYSKINLVNTGSVRNKSHDLRYHPISNEYWKANCLSALQDLSPKAIYGMFSLLT